MTTLTSSVPMLSNDFRATSIDKLRAKKRKTRYRYTNMNEVNKAETSSITGTTMVQWNDRNKFKMTNPNRVCRCTHCLASVSDKSVRKHFRIAADDYCDPLVCSSSSCPSGFYDLNGDEGVFYSYDRNMPTAGENILSQALGKAVEKMERKELERLVREEYDVIAEGDTDDSMGSGSDEDYELV